MRAGVRESLGDRVEKPDAVRDDPALELPVRPEQRGSDGDEPLRPIDELLRVERLAHEVARAPVGGVGR